MKKLIRCRKTIKGGEGEIFLCRTTIEKQWKNNKINKKFEESRR